MALTPEDVVNKRFQQTKFREGYDQDEVDDFLDEVVVELRRLIAENEQLRSGSDPAAATQVMPFGDGADQAEVARLEEELARLRHELDVSQQQLAQVDQELQNARTEAQIARDQAESAQMRLRDAETQVVQPQAFSQAGSMQGAAAGSVQSSNSLLELAQRLHDEHIAEGEAKRDELVTEAENRSRTLIAEAEGKSRRVREDAEKRANQIVNEAEQRQREIIGRLEAQKKTLEARIAELREFESDYRQQLRGYIEGQLRDFTKSAEVFDANVRK